MPNAQCRRRTPHEREQLGCHRRGCGGGGPGGGDRPGPAGGGWGGGRGRGVPRRGGAAARAWRGGGGGGGPRLARGARPRRPWLGMTSRDPDPFRHCYTVL